MNTPDFLPGHIEDATQALVAGQEPDFPVGHPRHDDHAAGAVGEQNPAEAAIHDPMPESCPPPLLDPSLMLAADILDDIERVRIANENRLRQMTRGGWSDERIKSGKYKDPSELPPDADGDFERGFGMDETDQGVANLAAMVDTMVKLEKDATSNLQKAMRRHPLGPWVKAQKGVGEKQAARLLAAIGDPYVNSATGRPRTVSALWAYSGLHVLPASHDQRDSQTILAGGAQTSDPGHEVDDNTRYKIAGVAAKRQKGQKANWSTNAKTRAYLIATSCIKQADSPYRAVYLQRRTHTATTHPDWTPGHSHNDALRVASKAILKDLWIAAREIHHAPEETR